MAISKVSSRNLPAQAAAPRWRRRAQARPGEIVDAALSVFAAKGFAATRLDDVARQAGVSKGTLYLYFDNKAELFKEMIRQTLLARFAASLERAEVAISASDALRALIAGVGKLLTDDRLSAIPKLIISESGNFPELAAFYLDEVIKPIRARITTLIERGVAHGEFRPIDTGLIYMLVMGPCLLSALWRHTMQPHDSVIVNVADLLRLHQDVLLNGLLAAGGKISEGA